MKAANEEGAFTPATTVGDGASSCRATQETGQNTSFRGEGAGDLHLLPKSQWLRPSLGVHSPVLMSNNAHGQSHLHGSGTMFSGTEMQTLAAGSGLEQPERCKPSEQGSPAPPP